VVVLRGALLLLIVAIAGYIMTLIYSAVLAYESGIVFTQLSLFKKKFSWNEIKTVTRPRFGVPYDFVYIVTTNGAKVPLVRGAKGYIELLNLIQSKSPNLTPSKLPENLSPQPFTADLRSSLLCLVILIAFIIAYSIFRIVFG